MALKTFKNEFDKKKKKKKKKLAWLLKNILETSVNF